jgi:hypothetical protein
MSNVDIKITLPDGLVREAEANGLLKPQAIEDMLRAEIRRRRVNGLFDAADRLADVETPALTQDEVEAEIQALRKSKRIP